MDDKKVKLYITYEDGYAEVEIEQDGVRRKHGTKYGNAENKDPREFCEWVANMVEDELGVPVQWWFVDGNNGQNSKDAGEKPKQRGWVTALKVAGAIFVSVLISLGIVFVVLVGDAYMRLDRKGNSTTPSTTDTTTDTDTEYDGSKKTIYDGFTKISISGGTSTPRMFEFGDGTFDSNDWYVSYVGTITNVSDKTRYFVKVRGTFTDDAGNAIDTDWTYACGDEGLKPGESTKFTLSVPEDPRITRVHYEIYDYR